MAIAFASAVIAGPAQAQQTRSDMSSFCSQQASRQNLKGDAQADFLTKCWAGGSPPSRQRCDAEARRQGLSGEDLSGFMKRCAAGEVALPAAAGSTK
ncbi:MAG TPA: hypothetical protein VJ890_20710 [Vineibacter sp.]|nr:hypothetical protein [Vineibacter sp.]